MTEVEIPTFSSEAEEARWWFDHAEELDDEFLAAAADGRLSQGSIAEKLGLSPNFIRLDPQDARLAHELASKRGIDFDEFVRNLVHEELLKREVSSESQTAA